MTYGDAVAEAVAAPLLRQPAPTAGQVHLLVHALRDGFPLDSLPCLLTAAARVTCWEEGHVAVLQAILGRQPVLCELGQGTAAAGVLRYIASMNRNGDAAMLCLLHLEENMYGPCPRCPALSCCRSTSSAP